MGIARKLGKAAGYTLIGGGVIYLWDQKFNSRAISRTGRTLGTGLLVAADYKLNWGPGKDVDALHERCADRLYNLITTNKGLYIKMGQMIAIQGNMLPAPYREKLSKLFDKAPQDTWAECIETFKTDLGKEPAEVFAEIDTVPVASASIAQVHKAKLKSGEQVAVKIQHHDIEQLTWWDLSSYKAMMWMYEKVFDFPVHFIAKFIADAVDKETDFAIELANATEMGGLVAGDKSLAKSIHVPKTFPDLSSRRVLVMEWADGIPLSRPDEVKQHYNVNKALRDIFIVTGRQCFNWGVVHCDPHPGNWLIRKLPSGQQQLVMLDHGLYMHMPPELVDQYTLLWNAIFRGDTKAVGEVVSKWGFGNPELFASATMLQSYDGQDINDFESEQASRDRLREFLQDTSKIPLQLIFVARAQRILQGVNRVYDSPVNRIKILADGALAANVQHQHTFLSRLGALLYRWFVLAVADVGYFLVRVRQLWTHEGLEDLFDEDIKHTAEGLLK